MNILDKIESVEEMATRLEVTPQLVRKWCDEQRIEAKKIGREWAVVKGQSKPEDLPKNFTADIKLVGLKKAVGDFNKWQGAARVYFDKNDLSVWTNVYASGNEWEEHQDKNIVEVLAKTSLAARDDKTSMRELQALCEAALK